MSPRDLEFIRSLVLNALAGYSVRVWLFGSAARGEAGPTSDVDVAVEAAEPLPPGLLAGIRERLEESPIVPKVDLVDMSEASAAVRAAIMREGLPWSA